MKRFEPNHLNTKHHRSCQRTPPRGHALQRVEPMAGVEVDLNLRKQAEVALQMKPRSRPACHRLTDRLLRTAHVFLHQPGDDGPPRRDIGRRVEVAPLAGLAQPHGHPARQFGEIAEVIERRARKRLCGIDLPHQPGALLAKHALGALAGVARCCEFAHVEARDAGGERRVSQRVGLVDRLGHRARCCYETHRARAAAAALRRDKARLGGQGACDAKRLPGAQRQQQVQRLKVRGANVVNAREADSHCPAGVDTAEQPRVDLLGAPLREAEAANSQQRPSQNQPDQRMLG